MQADSRRARTGYARLTSFVLVLLALGSGPAAQAQTTDVIVRGDALGDAPLVPLAEALSDIDGYLGRTVAVEGAVTRVCQMKGCWMELASDQGAAAVRVTFKDYGFFVPTDAQGHQARLEGEFETNVFPKEQVDHLAAEGVALTRNPDGTATEVSFVASGVELRSAE